MSVFDQRERGKRYHLHPLSRRSTTLATRWSHDSWTINWPVHEECAAGKARTMVLASITRGAIRTPLSYGEAETTGEEPYRHHRRQWKGVREAFGSAWGDQVRHGYNDTGSPGRGKW